MTADGDFLEISELGLDMPDDQELMNERKHAMLAKPAYIDSLVDRTAEHGALIVEMSVTSSDPWESLRFDPDGGDDVQNFYPQVPAHAISAILDKTDYDGIDFYLTGDVTMNTSYNEVIGGESGPLALATLLVAGLIALVNFRFHPLGFAAPLAVIVVSLVLMVGFMGLVGYDLTMLFLIAPNMLIAIGVAQSIHLISEFRLLHGSGLDRRSAVQQTFEHVAVPCLLAALTTALGIVAMAGSELRALAEMSIFLGVGVMLTFVGSITLMVCLLAFGPEYANATVKKEASDRAGMARFLSAVSAFNTRHSRLIIATFTALIVVCLMGVSQLRIAFNFIEDFKPSTDFRRQTDYIRTVMGGMLNVAIVYDSGKTDGIKSAALLNHMAGLQALADESPIVKKTYSLVDVLKDLNQSMHADDPASYVLPAGDELISQYLLLYEISGGRELEDYVSTDFQRTTLELRLDFVESDQIEALLAELQTFVDANPVSGVDIKFTGIGLLWVSMSDYIADSQLQGYTLVFIMIALILSVAFRSVYIGMIAMVPNLFPVFLVLGFMGWMDIALDYLRLLLATVVIGIAVDDTVHVVMRMKKEFLRTGCYQDAMHNALMSVGRALCVTTLILALAFLVYQMSSMEALSRFGTLLSVTMVAALLADLFLLPTLICTLKPFGPEASKAASS